MTVSHAPRTVRHVPACLPAVTLIATVIALTPAPVGSTPAQRASPGTPAADAPERVDYLSFAQGAIPIWIGGSAAAFRG
jgi:hypothetical protein